MANIVTCTKPVQYQDSKNSIVFGFPWSRNYTYGEWLLREGNCLSSLSVAMMSTLSKSNLKRTGFGFQAPIIVHRWRRPRQGFKKGVNLEAGAEMLAEEGLCFLRLAPHGFLAFFLTQFRATSPNHLSRKCLTDVPTQRSVRWRQFLSWGSLFPDDVSSCQGDRLTSTGSHRPLGTWLLLGLLMLQ